MIFQSVALCIICIIVEKYRIAIVFVNSCKNRILLLLVVLVHGLMFTLYTHQTGNFSVLMPDDYTPLDIYQVQNFQ